MPNLTAPPSSFSQSVYESSLTKMHDLGARAETGDGRVYRYAKAGGSALVAGNVLQAPAIVANHKNIAVQAAAAIGATTVSVTLGATAATANQYAGGWLMITLTPGNGHAYKISSHPAHAGSGTLVVTLSEPVLIALTTSSKAALVPNPYENVIQAPVTTLTGAVIGVAPFAVPASEYFWAQTRGPAACLVTGTPIVGSAVCSPSAAAGALGADPADAAVTVVGRMLEVGVTAQNHAVFLMLD